MKICPNCNVKHSQRKTEYCCREIDSECIICNEKYSYTCRKVVKKTCSRKCSAQLKNNSCLNCGEPCKEKYCKKEIKINCKNCGKEHTTKCSSRIGIYCSGVCAARDPEIKERAKETQFKNHGGVYAFNTEKQRKTMLERYDEITPAKNPKVKEKARQTQLKNHGGVYAFNTDKQKETMMEKYNSHGRLGDPKEMEKQIQTMLERYNVRTPSEHPEFLEKAMSTLMKNHGQIFNNSNISKVNLRFGEKLKEELNLEVEYEFHLHGRFYDIYLPEHSIAIEINPTITHNSNFAFACKRNKCSQPCEEHNPLPKDYHYKKSKLAMDNGIKLIQVYDWENEDDIVSMIRGKVSRSVTKHSARKLKIRKITQFEANKFLSSYHIQKGAKGQTHCYGLFLKEELLAVATFGKSRFKSKYQYEFIRYAVKEGVIIHGGSSKLVKEFINEVKPVNILSYIDFNHTTAKEIFLNSCGFEEIEPTGPRLLFYNEKKNKVVPMTSLLMIGADRILGTNYGPKSECGLDNEGIMEKEGYLKVYTSGNRVFLWGEKINGGTDLFDSTEVEEISNIKSKKKTEVICQMCNKPFIQKNKSKDGIVGCSPTCRFQLRNGTKPCSVCGEDFYPKTKNSKLCSAKCAGKLSNNAESSSKRKATLEKKRLSKSKQ